MIRDITDRIDRLLCGTRCHKHLLTCKVFVHCAGTDNIIHKYMLRWKLSFADIPACQISFVSLDDFISIGGKLLHVILHDRILIHMYIHGWSKHNRAGCRKHTGCEHIIRNSVCNLANYIRTCRCNQNCIRLRAERDMRYMQFHATVKCICITVVSCQYFKCLRCDKMCRILCHHNMDVCMQLGKHACNIRHLVGCDTTTYTEHDLLSCKHNVPPSPRYIFSSKYEAKLYIYIYFNIDSYSYTICLRVRSS